MAEISSSEQLAAPQPEFDGGAFTISHLSPSPEGFQFVTRKTIGRTEGISDNRSLSSDQRDSLKKGMQGELKFNNAQEVSDARMAWRTAESNGSDKEEIAGLRQDFYAKRGKYQEKGKKVGLRDIAVHDNVISADVKLVSFPMYNEFSSSENSDELLDLSILAGTAMIVKTADGRLILQHRAVAKQRLHEDNLTRGNASYPDVPGASVGGLVDASLQSQERERGTPDPVDTNSILRNIYKESGEELGLEPEALKQVRIVGLTHDKVKVHDVLLLYAESKLAADQIHEASRTSKRNKNLGDADFEEKFVDIEASPETIKKLLTQVKCPLPADHAAAFVAAGYTMVLQGRGVEAANQWKENLEGEVQNNFNDIDNKVKIYYEKHPEAKIQVPERYWDKNVPKRNLYGYTPAYAPEEQGLPSFEDEMVRTGLVPETRSFVPEADLFDVDGLITDPQTKKIIHPEILDSISDRLKAGIPVAINTGRSIEWLSDSLLSPLLERFNDNKEGLKNLAIIAEFGGTWATFDDKGDMQEGKVNSITVPSDLNDRAKDLINEKYNGSMFFDATKKTMISIEMQEGYDLAEFHKQQRQLAEELNMLLSEKDVPQTYEVHTDTIATNIRSPYVGKNLGADRFLQFLRDKNIKVGKFKTYGDSEGDLAMADELQRRGYDGDKPN